jgi:hypothetical protein
MIAALMAGSPAQAQDASAAGTAAPAPAVPFVRGGFDDKPYLHGIFGRIRVGGYLEADAFVEREEGATSEAGFELLRWNLLASTEVSSRVSVWSEVEFEDGGDEVTLELAQVDVRIVPLANLRGGILLSPLGRFNLAHDAPRNELPGRPLVATELIGVALSEPGFGLFGSKEWAASRRLTYEAYAVNGFRDGVILDSPDGTRVPAGKRNFEDENASPAIVGRVAVRARAGLEIGVSAHHGAYNLFQAEGVAIDERRDLTVAVGDLEFVTGPYRFVAEAATVRVDVPPGLIGTHASRQAGGYVEASRRFGERWIAAWPGASFAAAVRLEAVDFDRDLPGDSIARMSLGVNLRPSPESVIKAAWTRGRSRDRFDNAAQEAELRLSLATYF